MSLEVLTTGGGGGEFASIFVTGLSETDTVSASKDGKTVQGEWGQKPNPAYVGLPEGYTQLEYIESSGTQYIDTGLKGASGYVVDIKWMCTNSSPSDQTIIGSAFPVYLGINFSSSYLSFYLNYSGADWVDIKNVAAVNKMYDLTVGMLNGNQYVISDGVSIYSGTETGDVSNNYNITVLARNTNGSIANYANAKIYSLALKTSGGEIVRNYVPAKRNSDEVYGLYDLVNDVFYTNAGSGTFLAGAEIPATIDGFSISPIKSYGTWTVTATDGTDTATQDVLVDAAVEYEIPMSYRFYLYNEGDEYEDVTGGWSNDGYSAGDSQFSAPIKYDTYMRVENNGVSVTGGVGNQTPIDITGYTNVCMLITSNDAEVWILSSGKNAEANRIAGGVFTCTEEVKKWDVSGHSGTVNIAIYGYKWSTSRSADIYQVWLEK